MGAHIISLLTLEDTMALKEELFGFFSDAGARRAAKK